MQKTFTAESPQNTEHDAQGVSEPAHVGCKCARLGDTAAEVLAASVRQRDNGPWRPVRSPGSGPQRWGIETADKDAIASSDEMILHPMRELSRDRAQSICDSYNSVLAAISALPVESVQPSIADGQQCNEQSGQRVSPATGGDA